MSFSCRSLFVKFLHQKTNSLKLNKVSGENIYYVTILHICRYNTIVYTYCRVNFYNDYESVSLLNISTGVYQLTNHYAILAANSACFTLYNAASLHYVSKIQNVISCSFEFSKASSCNKFFSNYFGTSLRQ